MCAAERSLENYGTLQLRITSSRRLSCATRKRSLAAALTLTTTGQPTATQLWLASTQSACPSSSPSLSSCLFERILFPLRSALTLVVNQ